MSDIIAELKQKAQKKYKKVVFPESYDERVLQAAAIILREKIAQVILLGAPARIKELADKAGAEIAAAEIIDPKNYARTEELANLYYARRKHKGATLDEAQKLMTEDPVFAGAGLVGIGAADCMVCGCITATAKVIKSALFCVGMQKNISLVSSYFMMVSPDKSFGENGVLFFADCAVNPDPDAAQLADIAKCTADSMRQIIGARARIALLSFSTKGSAAHPAVEKITKALQIVKEKYPELDIDGELQADAALIPAVGRLKAPGSAIAGQANTLIFPDLNAGNIGYKLVQRFGKAEAIGPVLQGLAKPVNDLSRGCSAQDIVNTVIITELQTGE
ncbi:phosphate acetyltransferase [Candidatus Termititenax aidoneus]|uniref:Phosphate acetyltransferase n=1 Tax=Termititenax aidoneus TaxID=2218524 RepID=A0A388T8C1_TERA1|nr:phosphate acetyltransferase [Candidatus Termititenax aidoneus]